MKQLTFLSLFSGIGGLDLGLERAGMKCIGQVEIDPFCRRVLAKHWPDVLKWDDVRTFYAGMLDERPAVIAGGFPCQDISMAGDRAGIDGERSGLWSEFHRIICELRPDNVLVENVTALLIPIADDDGIKPAPVGRVLGDLAESGFDAEWLCMPAGRLGAHHRRDRVFIFAHRADASGLRPQWQWPALQGSWSREQFEGLVQAELQLSVPAGAIGGISDRVADRKHRLHALGNAVVPQVAEYIGHLIVQAAREEVTPLPRVEREREQA